MSRPVGYIAEDTLGLIVDDYGDVVVWPTREAAEADNPRPTVRIRSLVRVARRSRKAAS